MLDWILSLDRALFTQINSIWTHRWLDVFFPFITDLHKSPYFQSILTPLVFLFFVWRRGLKKGLLIFIFTVLSFSLADGIGNHVFKQTIQRPRPPNDPLLVNVITRSPYGGYSFVSNHASNNFGYATFLSLVFPIARLPLYGLAILVSYSRVYNGVHYPTDVLAGALLGILCGYLMYLLYAALIRYLGAKALLKPEATHERRKNLAERDNDTPPFENSKDPLPKTEQVGIHE